MKWVKFGLTIGVIGVIVSRVIVVRRRRARTALAAPARPEEDAHHTKHLKEASHRVILVRFSAPLRRHPSLSLDTTPTRAPA